MLDGIPKDHPVHLRLRDKLTRADWTTPTKFFWDGSHWRDVRRHLLISSSVDVIGFMEVYSEEGTFGPQAKAGPGTEATPAAGDEEERDEGATSCGQDAGTGAEPGSYC